jgi:hypothetical protein
MCNNETEKLLKQVELRVKGNFIAIKQNPNRLDIKKNIAVLINKIKNLDEVLYNQLLNEYKIILNNVIKNNA